MGEGDETWRIDRIHSLGLGFLSGKMPTFYSPHAMVRARYLQALLGGEIEFYSRLFHIEFAPVDMAVLDTGQWPLIAGKDPYGMPSVAGSKPYVFVMPANWDQVTWMQFPKREKVPDSVLRQAVSNERTWNQVEFEGCDGIGTHEIGHSIVHQLGIDPQSKWLNEFLASYVGYAYLKSTHPKAALSSEIFWTQGLESPHPVTTLDDFERRSDELEQQHPENYGWYQLAFDQRVMEIYSRQGVDYLRKIRASFAKSGQMMDSRQVLDKLEAISPGWKRWAAQVESGEVQPLDLTKRMIDQ